MDLLICNGDIRNEFAKLTHRIWCMWIKRVINAARSNDGDNFVAEWECKSKLSYDSLPEEDKDSYLNIVDSYSSIFNEFTTEDTKPNV